MNEPFASALTEGGHTNSLGRVNEVIDEVLCKKERLSELYDCIFHEDAWVRMRAIDAFEKVCRQHPKWIEPYIDRIQKELSKSQQTSIKWHIAQIYDQVELAKDQREIAITWLQEQIKTPEVDWIVSANAMQTLASFAKKDLVSKSEIIPLFEIQLGHKSNAVVKRANKYIKELAENV